MSAYICTTCGTQYAPTPKPPSSCPICLDPRQYVGHDGQSWITLPSLQQKHKLIVTPHPTDPRIISITMQPPFAINQRAILLRTPEGLFMWDCLPLLDDSIISRIQSWGGLKAISISHPHFYSSCVSWSEAFGNVPIYISKADVEWLQYPHENIKFWDGPQMKLTPNLTLIRCGGHFDGSAVLHWSRSDLPSILFTADTIMPTPAHTVSVMWSYPNLIPLSPKAVRDIWNAIKEFEFDEIEGGFEGRFVRGGAKQTVLKSLRMYIRSEGYEITDEELEIL